MSFLDFNDRFNAAFPRGLGINSNPISQMPAQPLPTFDPSGRMMGNLTSIQGQPPALPGSLPNPVDRPIPSAVPGNEVGRDAFPTGAAPPVPYGPAPSVMAGGQSGLTLNSTPPAMGWGGTVGMESAPPPAATPAFDSKGLEKGLETIVKGIQNKQPVPSDMNTITPMSSGGGNIGGSGAGQMGANLLAQLLAASRQRYT